MLQKLLFLFSFSQCQRLPWSVVQPREHIPLLCPNLGRYAFASSALVARPAQPCLVHASVASLREQYVYGYVRWFFCGLVSFASHAWLGK